MTEQYVVIYLLVGAYWACIKYMMRRKRIEEAVKRMPYPPATIAVGLTVGFIIVTAAWPISLIFYLTEGIDK